MISAAYDIGDEGLRLLANLEQHYAVWLEAARILLPGRLTWKSVSNHEYLYRIVNGKGDGRSLGPRSAATEALFEAAQRAKQVVNTVWPTLQQEGAIYRTLRLPRISTEAAKLLREFDLHGLMGTSLLVVGTNALAAYEIEARTRFVAAAGVDSTQDFDLTWVSTEPRQTVLSAVGAAPRTLIDVMKRVDSTYTINTERTFQVRNAAGYEVELLMPKSLEGTLPKSEPLSPVGLPEQDWLLPGRRVEHVVCGFDGVPARLVVPDPRWFALHKLWLADKPSRNPLKKPKDAKQGALLLSTLLERMPHYPMDDGFRAALPVELQQVLDQAETYD